MKSKRVLLASAAAFIVMTLVVAACATPSSSMEVTQADSSQKNSAGQEAEESTIVESDQTAGGKPIRIGALVPLSAPGSVVGGEAMRDAMVIAADEINASGGLLGRPVELIVVDSEGLPERGVAGSERLINQQGVVAIAGGYHSSVGVVVKEVAHNYGIPSSWPIPGMTPSPACNIPKSFVLRR